MRSITLLTLLLLASAPPAAARAELADDEAVAHDVDEDVAPIEALRAERDATPLDAPAALTLTSAVLFPGGVVSGMAVVLLDARLCLTGPCEPRATRLDPTVQSALGGTLLAVGVSALLTMISGAIWWGTNNHHRRALTRRIQMLEVELDASITPDGGTIGLSGRF